MQHEAIEQTALFRWIAFARATMPELDMLYHIPNGGSRNRKEAYHLKQQGVRPGIPDLCLPVARGKFHGLYIELKYGKNKPTDYQREWIEKLQRQGYATAVCYGWMQAKECLEKYLSLEGVML